MYEVECSKCHAILTVPEIVFLEITGRYVYCAACVNED